MNSLLKGLSVLCLACLLAVPISAQSLPKDVLEPYKAYRAADNAGEKEAALKAAEKAYKAAEKHMGDSKVTGDLAQIVADSMPFSREQKAYTRKIETYLRSAELAKFYEGDEAVDMELQRLIKAAETYHLMSSNKGGRKALELALEVIEAHGLEGSTYEGEVRTLISKRLLSDGKKSFAMTEVDKAIAILENPSDTLPSLYLPIARLHKASMLKKEKDVLPAALIYQDVMQNAEGKVSSKHRMVSTAFQNWMYLRYELEAQGRLGEAEKAGLCECWPFDEYKDKLIPLKRTPPDMPRGFLEGSNSGYVTVKFDVSDAGKPYNVEILTTTSKLLIEPSIKCVEEWTFSEKIGDEPEDARKGVMNRITYIVTDERGRHLPMPF